MNEAPIIRGITPVDPSQHIALSNYRSQVPECEGIHVIEMENSIARHLGGLMLVFGRWITPDELERRKAAYEQDPAKYGSDHIQSLAK